MQVATARVAFVAPGQQVNGLEAVPEGLWLCDQRDNHAYLVDNTGGVIRSFPSPARNASGITVGAGSVWIASNVAPAMIFRHDALTGQCTAFVMLEGAGGVHGLQWRPYAADETRPTAADSRPELHPSAPAGRRDAGPGVSGTLWVSRPGARRVDHIDAETGALLGSIAFPVDRSHGMFWDERNGTLSVAETNHGHILRFEPQSGDLLEEWRIDGPEVHGLTLSADGRIWVGDASSNEVLIIER
jgi:streptogramin lyase